MSESKQYEVLSKSSAMGKTSIQIKCPFCSQVSKTYVWSLAGNGKRCTNSKCDALFVSWGYATLKPRTGRLPGTKETQS